MIFRQLFHSTSHAAYTERRQLLLTPKVAKQKFETKADITIRGLPSTERRYA